MQYDDDTTNSRWRIQTPYGRTPYWKSFLALSRRYIDLLMWNLKRRWRITCRYRSSDQNGNFRKFKMADGRHFENSFISISQPRFIGWISITFGAQMQTFFPRMDIWQKNRNFANSRWRSDAILKIVFAIYLDAVLVDLCKIWRDAESHEYTGHMTKTAIFENSRWLKAAILKIVYLDISAANHPISIKLSTFTFRCAFWS